MAGERQVAIVTGAASGIGRAMTLGLLEGGIDVAAVDKEAVWLDELRAEAGGKGFGGALQTIRADLTDPASFESIVSTMLGTAGHIDILVNNAGIGQGSIRADQRRNPLRFWEITPEQWGRRLGTMLREGYILYGASKAAAEAATAVMSADLAGTGVTANVLVPGGMTDTRIVPDAAVADRSRLPRPEIMAPPLLWLVSDSAAGVSGRRFLAAHWDTALPPAEAAEKCGAPIAWKSIATMPIEPD
jgi:NAD(P)-dependent dehydrogenase (short-subunit alcohol dehydrogenase family)